MKAKEEKFGIVYATQNGIILPIEDMPDEVFAAKVLGDGICLVPADGKVYCPVAGVIESIADAGHAFGVVALDGADIMIHIGVDTVEMAGKGFKNRVYIGQRLKVGDLLCEVDLPALMKAGYAIHTAVLLTNPEMFKIVNFYSGNAVAGITRAFQYQRQD